MAAAAAVIAAGAAAKAAGSMQAGSMQSDSLNWQAQADANNAQVAEQQGQYDSSLAMMRAAQKIGTQKAAYGAAGVDVNSGSAAQMLAQSAANAEMDRLNIIHGADIKATNFMNQANLDTVAANNAILAGKTNAMAGLFGGAGSIMSNSGTASGDAGGGNAFTGSYGTGSEENMIDGEGSTEVGTTSLEAGVTV